MIRPAIKSDSYSLARLHSETLKSGFLAGLGLLFLNNLYVFLIKKEHVWVYEEKSKVKGFVSFSSNSVGMMKRFLISCPTCLLLLIFRIIVQPSNIKRFLETFRAPFKSNKVHANDSVSLPSGELLSISVSPDCQALGIGGQLIMALEDSLRQSQITHYKVVAGENLVGANKFYLKNRFVLATQIRIHGKKLSNVYIKEV